MFVCLFVFAFVTVTRFVKKKVYNTHPNGFGCRLSLSKYHPSVSMLWWLRLPVWFTSSSNMCKHWKQKNSGGSLLSLCLSQLLAPSLSPCCARSLAHYPSWTFVIFWQIVRVKHKTLTQLYILFLCLLILSKGKVTQ